MNIDIRLESLPFRTPFRIAGYTFAELPILTVRIDDGAHAGYGEAAGVYYRNDTPARMAEQIEALGPVLAGGIDREALSQLLPSGGARNALDCALWDLEAKRSGTSVSQAIGLTSLKPIMTTYTLGADEPEAMAAQARAHAVARALKLKLLGDSVDAARVRAVRAARPDVWLSIDANQGYRRATFQEMLPVFLDAGVALIEQPLPAGQDAELAGVRSPIPIAADESVQGLADLPRCMGLFDMINIKLDKCGGLTEGLLMASAARRLGFKVMVGNMAGTSLAMAPAFLLGQLCDVVDLDGPMSLAADRVPGVSYDDGYISCPETVWGAPESASA